MDLASRRDVIYLMLLVLRDMVQRARGNLITFRASVIASRILQNYLQVVPDSEQIRSLSKKIRDVLETLCDLGLVQVVKRGSRGKVYGMYRTSPLFLSLQVCNDDGVTCLADLFHEYIYSMGNSNDRTVLIHRILQCTAFGSSTG